MAQNFRNQLTSGIGTSSTDILDAANTFDAIIGIRLANISSQTISVTVTIERSSADFIIIKNAEILQGSSLELIDGGSKINLHSGDKVKAISSIDNSLDTVVSFIDNIST
tara:strand:- start:961 stop:1290 length:330 start_codon:yes stop_codon:yes gene_type:complete